MIRDRVSAMLPPERHALSAYDGACGRLGLACETRRKKNKGKERGWKSNQKGVASCKIAGEIERSGRVAQAEKKVK